MRTVLRVTTVSVGVLVLVALVLALTLPHLLDPNAYKDRLGALVKERTGHALTISGEIKLAVFPWLALEVGPVQLANAPGFGAAPLIAARSAAVRIKLWPLLHHQVQMDKVSLDGVVVHLARDARGRDNWQGLSGPSAAPATSQTGPSGSGTAVALLGIGGLELRDARIDWSDARAGSYYQLSDVSVHTGRFEPGKPVAVQLVFALAAGRDRPAYRVHLKGKVSADPAAQRYRAQGVILDVDLPQGGTATVTSDLDLDLAKQRLTLPALELRAQELKLTGSVQASKIIDAPDLRGELQIAEFSPRALLQALGKPVPGSADAAVLGKASARCTLRAGKDRLSLDPLTARLDDSTFSGRFALHDFVHPHLAVNLEVNEINLDRYLPRPGQSAAGVVNSAYAAESPGALPVALLRDLNLDGSLHIGRLQAYRLRSADVRINAQARDGVLHVQPATAQLYQGRYQGDLELDARGAAPRLSMNEALHGVQIGDLLKDLRGSARFTGIGEVSARLQATGADLAALRRSLSGSLAFDLRDGAVRGFNLAALIRQAKAALKGQVEAADTGQNQTDFSALSGTAAVTNGVVRNDDLRGQSPYLRVTGAGQIDLGAETLDYLLKAVLVSSGEGQGGAGLADLQGVAVPVRISGALTAPRYRVDLNAALGEAAKARLREQQQQLEQKLQDKLQDKLKGLLR